MRKFEFDWTIPDYDDGDLQQQWRHDCSVAKAVEDVLKLISQSPPSAMSAISIVVASYLHTNLADDQRARVALNEFAHMVLTARSNLQKCELRDGKKSLN